MAKRTKPEKKAFLDIESETPPRRNLKVAIRGTEDELSVQIRQNPDADNKEQIVICCSDGPVWWLDSIIDADGLAQALIYAAAEFDRTVKER